MKGTLQIKQAQWKDRHPADLPYWVVFKKEGENEVLLTPSIRRYEDADMCFDICTNLLRAQGAIITQKDKDNIEWEIS